VPDVFHTKPDKRRLRAVIASAAHAKAHECMALRMAKRLIADCRTGDEARQRIDQLIGDVEVQVQAMALGQVGHA